MSRPLLARQSLRRRGLLAAGLAGAGVSSAGLPASAHRRSTPAPKVYGRPSRTKVITLGTSGGPPWSPDGHRAGISTAVVVGDRYYLVDAGDGVGHRLVGARIPGWDNPLQAGVLSQLRAVFLTHLHSDHVSDLSNLFTVGLANGLPRAGRPVEIYGPGNRGALPPLFGPAPAPPVVAPKDPTPGTEALCHHLIRAYAQDFNDRARDNRLPVPEQVIRAHDIALPDWVTADPNGEPHPRMSPVPVYEDERVKVTATLVQHAPVFPAFGFRFDTDDGSITVSGDTSPSDNLVELATDTDLLLHEVIAAEALDQQFPQPRTDSEEAIVNHLLSAHTTIQQVADVAERSNAACLALHHFVPGNWPRRRWFQAERGYSGKLIVSNDLDVMYVGG